MPIELIQEMRIARKELLANLMSSDEKEDAVTILSRGIQLAYMEISCSIASVMMTRERWKRDPVSDMTKIMWGVAKAKKKMTVHQQYSNNKREKRVRVSPLGHTKGAKQKTDYITVTIKEKRESITPHERKQNKALPLPCSVSSRPPIRTRSGFSKSRTAVPSAKNSGLLSTSNRTSFNGQRLYSMVSS